MADQKIKLITFDLDGTIIDDEWAHEQAKTEIAKSLGVDGDLNLQYYTGRSNRLFWTSVCEGFSLTYKDVEELTRRQFRRVLELLQEKKQPESKGLTETMYALKQEGFTVAVTSGSDEFFVDGILNYLNISKYVDVKITKNFVRFVKPDPDIYLAAMRMTNIQPECSIGIEDSNSGCQALKSAGMICIGYSNEGKNPQTLEKADYTISVMTELIPLVKRLNA